MARTLTHEEAEAFYDRLGSRQDAHARFEDRARLALAAGGGFGEARAVVEFGCGTGMLAARLLSTLLPEGARYLGLDVSSTMVELTRARLRAWSDRAEVRRTDGSMRLPVPGASFDRFVSTYVLDLLSEKDIRDLLGEAHRVLSTDGILCLAGLTEGRGLLMRLWRVASAAFPKLLGGCRPLRLVEFLHEGSWRLERRQVISVLGVDSEVVVARRV